MCPNCIEGRPGRPRAHAGLQVEAHDSGDGKTIYHCPFCGAGQVVGGSDGTTECQYCHTFFTVQVQPEFAAFPQTINGQPVQVPGMPGDPTQPTPSPDGPTTADDKNDPFQPPDQPDAFKPPDEPEPPDDKPNPFQGVRAVVDPRHQEGVDDEWRNAWECPRCDHVNPEYTSVCGGCGFDPLADDPDIVVIDGQRYRSASRRLYLVSEGVAIPEESYMRRLALEHAPDRDEMLADLRSAR